MKTAAIILALASWVSLAAAETVNVTPHAQFGSSAGVLGCKININRVAYWPTPVDCNKLCVKVSANGRHVHLLKIDRSGGAHDISWDAWNYLVTGKGARQQPTQGGGISAEYEFVDMKACGSLLHEKGNKLALSALTASTTWSACPADSWVGQNSVLYNYGSSSCNIGSGELCTLTRQDLAAGINQPNCPEGLGKNTTQYVSDPKDTKCRVKDLVYTDKMPVDSSCVLP